MSFSLPPSISSLPPSVVSDFEEPNPKSDGPSVPSLPSCRSSEASDGADLMGVDVSEEDEGQSGFDEAVDFIDDIEEFNELAELSDPDGVPLPEIARLLTSRHDIAEYYNPPRALVVGRQRGLSGSLSLDIISGWDFKIPSLRSLSLELLSRLCICLVILSPPCIIFSDLQRLWNFKRMSQSQVRLKWDEGMLHLKHAMDCALVQYNKGRFFLFEHPARASSWKQDPVKRIMGLPGVFTVVVDMCMLALKNKLHRTPMQKRTRLMTNSHFLASRFAGHKCDRSHDHAIVQGSEGGVSRAVWAQVYPRPFVDILVDGALDHVCS